MNKAYEDFQTAGQEGYKTCVNSATAMSNGVQEIASETADYSAKSLEKGAAAFETLLSAKTFDKAFEIQKSFAKEAYEDFIGQMTKVGELYKASATEAYKPVEAQIAKFNPAATAKKSKA